MPTELLVIDAANRTQRPIQLVSLIAQIRLPGQRPSVPGDATNRVGAEIQTSP